MEYIQPMRGAVMTTVFVSANPNWFAARQMKFLSLFSIAVLTSRHPFS